MARVGGQVAAQPPDARGCHPITRPATGEPWRLGRASASWGAMTASISERRQRDAKRCSQRKVTMIESGRSLSRVLTHHGTP